MTKEEIISGNKLIAEFMDAIYKPTTNGMFGSYEHFEFTKNTFDDGDFKRPYDLQYHSSWDWLMPVIEKIGVNNKGYIDLSVDYFFEGDIFSVWLAVTEFIKWYNKQ